MSFKKKWLLKHLKYFFPFFFFKKISISWKSFVLNDFEKFSPLLTTKILSNEYCWGKKRRQLFRTVHRVVTLSMYLNLGYGSPLNCMERRCCFSLSWHNSGALDISARMAAFWCKNVTRASCVCLVTGMFTGEHG